MEGFATTGMGSGPSDEEMYKWGQEEQTINNSEKSLHQLTIELFEKERRDKELAEAARIEEIIKKGPERGVYGGVSFY